MLPEQMAEPLDGNYFVSTYPPFSCWDRAGGEHFREALDTAAVASPRPFGLYLHIPFCSKRCAFCYYLAHDDRSESIAPYVEALLEEAAMLAGKAALRGREVGFVYIGGGTPSMLSAARVSRLLDGLQAALPFTHAREVSFECSPRTVTREKVQALSRGGVTRVSLGVQQLDDEVLRESGRVHLVQDVLAAYELIRSADFAVVNLDLIVGMLGETTASFERSLEQTIALDPDSVTIYQLEVPHNTPVYRAARAGTLPSLPASWPVKRERLERAFARLEEAGYTVRSGYTAVRDPEKHRFVYQDEQYHGADLLGLGVASFSHLAGVNHQNRADLEGYLAAIQGGELPIWRGLRLSDEERMVREFVLQLKLGGAGVHEFRARHGVELAERFAEPLAELMSRGEVSVTPDAITLTRHGLLRVDRILPAFYLPRHRGVRYS